jgi:endonuclease YncB( thermonuclease family)
VVIRLLGKLRHFGLAAVMGAAVLIAALWATDGRAADNLVNEFSVVDGDTLQIGNHVYSLYGIDAPELGQLCLQDGRWNRCGITAAFELKKLLEFDKPLRCEPAPADKRRIVCHAASVNVALVLLKAGYAVAATGSDVAYRQAEKSAREGNLGLWHMSFVSPWDWRHGRRLPGADAASENMGCPVRGIVDDKGRKVYYVPTDSDYKKIAIEDSKGGRLFCSDGEARHAGWRRPGEFTKAR